MKSKSVPFTCPACSARLIVPQIAPGVFSPNLWQCPNMLCGKVWTADEIDAHRKADMQKSKKARV